MKTILSTYEAADILLNDENANWSRSGALALVEYLKELEEDTGEEIEFDRVAIRCDFSEYSGLNDWAVEYFGGALEMAEAIGLEDCDDDEEMEEAIRSYIQDHGTLIEFDGGVIVSSF